MKIIKNPFITAGYISPEYFCNRDAESEQLINEIINGNNLALISTRRMGKTGLIQHCFQKKSIKADYYTFFVDIYASKSLRDFIFMLSKVILETLKPHGKKVFHQFWDKVKSLQAGISFDMTGNPSFHLGLGDIQSPEATLDELFKYLAIADKPCLIAIDEFQQITAYPEKNVEAILRTYIQQCTNAHFIFAGSQQHIVGNLFLSAARPFYQSVSMMHLGSIDLQEYTKFAKHHFEMNNKKITAKTIEIIYNRFEGITWYVQKTVHILYTMTPVHGICKEEMIEEALRNVIDSFRYAYSETLFRLPEKQKELLIAIAKEGNAQALTSGAFVKKYKLTSGSSVQAGLKGLLEKDFITKEKEFYKIYDKFLSVWLLENY
ncbi:MAG: ATPase [Dysgonamonadaceae bacterium]|jgi:AAA+ ATPase superfamily predicted ATPase|nr:ATPase [Dysgonamonadaceae bacterium]